MTGLARAVVLAACAVALTACVSVPRGRAVQTGSLSGTAESAARARQSDHEATLAKIAGISFSGRVALSNGRDGGSGRLEWTQSGAHYDVTLSAPVTRQSWRLSGDAGGGRIEGVKGGPREGPDVQALLREATGQDIPVGALAAWATGARADAARFGPAKLAFAADGRLARIEQGGWTIDYLGWQADDAGAADAGDSALRGIDLPDRIDARRGDAKVRLAIDDWSLGGDAQ